MRGLSPTSGWHSTPLYLETRTHSILMPVLPPRPSSAGLSAHGMLTLAYVAEMLASAFGRSWLETGRLKVRLKGAAYPGDRLTTWGHVVKEEATGSHLATECAVGLINQRGEDIITGSAYLTRPVG